MAAAGGSGRVSVNWPTAALIRSPIQIGKFFPPDWSCLNHFYACPDGDDWWKRARAGY